MLIAITFPKRRLWLLPWLILALGFGGTLALWRNVRQDEDQVLNAEFKFWVNKVSDRIESRLSSNVQVLRGVVGLFEASETVTRQGFHRYVATLGLKERYPGIQGIGFSLLIPSGEKAAHVAAIRQEGFPDYAIRSAGTRDFYTAVIYIEPFFARNLRAFGYDMSLDPARWTAAARARDEGQATLSAKVTLQQETATDIQPGVLMFVPVYRPNAPHDTLAARRANLIGWAFSPLRMHDLMHSLLGAVEFEELRADLNVEVYDGVQLAPEALLFALHPVTTAASTAAFQAVQRLQFGGQPWSVQLTSTPRFEARLHSDKAILIALAGSLISLLLALLIGLLTTRQMRSAAALREAARNIVERQQAEAALRESEARFRSYFELSLIGVAITALDKSWLEVNGRLCEMLGYSSEALRQKTWAELTHPDDLAADVAQFNRVLAGEMDGYSLEKRFVGADGRVVPTDLSVACVRNAEGQPRYFVALAQDIAERKQIEAALHFTQAVVDRMSDAVYWARPDGHLIYVNAAACRMLGYASAELLAFSVRDILPDGVDDRWADHWRDLQQAGSLTFESQHQNKSGAVIPVEIRADYIKFQGAEYACGLARDITERKRLQEALQEQAIRDPLTGLFNRRYLDETLPRELSRCQRSGEPLAVAMLDLDHFKHFNDVYGHEAGDRVLRMISLSLRQSLRASDIACRYGGEELTVVMPGSSLEDAQDRLDQVRKAIQQLHLRYRAGELPMITVSIGVAAAAAEEIDATLLLGRADAALYQAKEQGRNRLVAALPAGFPTIGEISY